MTTIPDRMRSAVLTATNTIELQRRPVPEPASGEVLVQIGSVGVCGSDVHYYKHGRIGSMVVNGPLVLGHEASGRIVATGPGVDTTRNGQRVALEPQRPCRRCTQCKTGHYNLCPHMEFFATPPIDGAFCDYVAVPADFAHPVHERLSDDAVALLEPLSVGIWACHKAGIEPGVRVFIAGAGPIGAVTAQAARAAGATEVTVSDPIAARRDRITGYGATAAIDPATRPDFPAMQVDAFIDCSGAEPAVLDGIRAVRPGGAVVLVGLGPTEMTLPIQQLQNREITLTGTFRYVNTWPKAIALAESGAVDLDSMVTGRYALEDTDAALNADDDPDSMKAVIAVNQ